MSTRVRIILIFIALMVIGLLIVGLAYTINSRSGPAAEEIVEEVKEPLKKAGLSWVNL
jgi:hypothetical protein